MRRERHGRVDERAARHVDRGHERAEREQEDRVAEERARTWRRVAGRHAPTSPNGTRTRAPTRTEKMNAAATNPPTRVSSSGPMPIPSRWSSVAGIVIEFHSPMSRMNSTLPDAVDGESEPNVASCRAYQGATASSEQRDRAERRDERDARRARRRSPPNADASAEPVPQPDGAQDREHEDAVVARQRRDAGEQARGDERAAAPAQAAGGEPQRPGDERLVQREVVGLDHVHERQRRERDEDRPRRAATIRGAPASRAIDPGSGAAVAPMSANGIADANAVGPEEPDERHLDERGERHPVRVRRDRQDRVRRDRAADLGEDPDEVDVEAVARGELARDVHVVEGIGVRGVGKQRRGDEAGDEGDRRTKRWGSAQPVQPSTGLGASSTVRIAYRDRTRGEAIRADPTARMRPWPHRRGRGTPPCRTPRPWPSRTRASAGAASSPWSSRRGSSCSRPRSSPSCSSRATRCSPAATARRSSRASPRGTAGGTWASSATDTTRRRSTAPTRTTRSCRCTRCSSGSSRRRSRAGRG